MIRIGNFDFPELGNVDETREWKPAIRSVALAQKVLCVARTRIEGAWCAYCNSTRGENHARETEGVLYDGDKLPHKIALAIFPEFEGVPYAH